MKEIGKPQLAKHEGRERGTRIRLRRNSLPQLSIFQIYMVVGDGFEPSKASPTDFPLADPPPAEQSAEMLSEPLTRLDLGRFSKTVLVYALPYNRRNTDSKTKSKGDGFWFGKLARHDDLSSVPQDCEQNLCTDTGHRPGQLHIRQAAALMSESLY
jgi:hypothetical protein